MEIIKASGEKEKYQSGKVVRSLKRAGVSSAAAEKVEKEIGKEIKPGDTTEELFERVREKLVKQDIAAAARYSLRKAIMDLGPAGFYFERYIARVLEKYGYKTRIGRMVKGKCVIHEIDIVAEAPDVRPPSSHAYLIEAKYHNRRGVKSDIKDVMYMHSRSLDISEGENKEYKAWLITNTKFTTKAQRYGKCRNLVITGWRYSNPPVIPSGAMSLERLIEDKGLYPTTIFPAVSRGTRLALSEHNVYFAYELAGKDARELVKKFGVKKQDAEKIEKQAAALFKL